MKDANLFKENNARHMCHPMAHAADGLANIASGCTCSGRPAGAAAFVCLKETQRANGKDNAAARGKQMMAGIEVLQAKHDVGGDLRGGQGLVNALELTPDRATRKPRDAPGIMASFDTVHANGGLLRVSGPNPIVSPPLVLTPQDVPDILCALDKGMLAT